MSPSQFERLCGKVYKLCGIKLQSGKEQLVHSRLIKRLGALGLDNFEQYFDLIEGSRKDHEIIWMIDALTTNKTSFFREVQHYDFLRNKILPGIGDKRLRIWSAACSSGEEPYSIAITLAETLKSIKAWDIKILATDISINVLKKARDAVYSNDILEPVPQAWKQKYFRQEDRSKRTWRVVPELTNLVSFARLNFMDHFPMKGPFDVIFCRNAMIYFDKKTQEKLVGRFYDLIAPGGYLLVGHAESLSGSEHKFRYIQPATYQK
jgi:chemotaxis protein methyltransferase CheR